MLNIHTLQTLFLFSVIIVLIQSCAEPLFYGSTEVQ